MPIDIDLASLPPYFWPLVGGAAVVLVAAVVLCAWRRRARDAGHIRGGPGGDPLLQNTDVHISIREPVAAAE